MLKRLRIQFIAIIMALLTLLLGSVIGLIYHFTRQSLVKESHDMMDSLAASPFQLARLDEASNRVNLPLLHAPGQQIRRDSRHRRRLLRPLGRRFPARADRRHLFLHRHAGRNSAISPPLQPLSAAKRAAPRLCRHHERTGHAPRPAPQQSPARRRRAAAVLRRQPPARPLDRSARSSPRGGNRSSSSPTPRTS